MKESIYGLVQTRLYYGSIWQKTDCPQLSMDVFCETVYGIHAEVYIGLYINQALLWINMAKHQNCWATFRESIPYRISAKSVNQFM
jgi:hypothetical protein